jgi:hypothetical protein
MRNVAISRDHPTEASASCNHGRPIGRRRHQSARRTST